MQHKFKYFRRIETFRLLIEKKVEAFGSQYKGFAIFGILNYPSFYIIWKHYGQTGYENLSLRLSLSFLCIILLLNDFWPKRLKSWLPVYWYATLLLCLPFFFFFMLFMNNGVNVWLMSSNTILFWLLFLVEPISYIFILTFGILLAWVAFLFFHPSPIFDFGKWWGVATQFIASFIVVAISARKRYEFNEKKLQAMQTLATTLAHEIRTPLASIQANIMGTKNYWTDLLTGYKAAKNEKLLSPTIRGSQLALLEKSFDRIQRETNFANTVINMLLANVSLGKLKQNNLELCSANECVAQALERYPFAELERDVIQWENTQDFFFKGKAILFIHTLFNLIKNALYHIKAANKGYIRIWHDCGEHYNELHFLDTGAGIAPHLLPRIFEHFFSNTQHGSGIGLTFCKAVIESFDGNIECYSVEGEYAKFVLKLPKVS